MAPSAGRLHGHLLLLRSLQLLLHSTKIAATVASDSQLAFFPGNTRTPHGQIGAIKFDGACRPAMTKQDQAGVPCLRPLFSLRPPTPYGLFRLNFDPGGVLSRQVYGSAATAPRSCAS
jgi:hypothetical protein